MREILVLGKVKALERAGGRAAGRLHDLPQFQPEHGRFRRDSRNAHAEQKLEGGRARIVLGLAAQASRGGGLLLERIFRAELAGTSTFQIDTKVLAAAEDHRRSWPTG